MLYFIPLLPKKSSTLAYFSGEPYLTLIYLSSSSEAGMTIFFPYKSLDFYSESLLFDPVIFAGGDYTLINL